MSLAPHASPHKPAPPPRSLGGGAVAFFGSAFFGSAFFGSAFFGSPLFSAVPGMTSTPLARYTSAFTVSPMMKP